MPSITIEHGAMKAGQDKTEYIHSHLNVIDDLERVIGELEKMLDRYTAPQSPSDIESGKKDQPPSISEFREMIETQTSRINRMRWRIISLMENLDL